MAVESSARVVNARVYVALGRDVEQSKSTLLWALDNFDGHFRILHVHQPDRIDTTGQCCGIVYLCSTLVFSCLKLFYGFLLCSAFLF